MGELCECCCKCCLFKNNLKFFSSHPRRDTLNAPISAFRHMFSHHFFFITTMNCYRSLKVITHSQVSKPSPTKRITSYNLFICITKLNSNKMFNLISSARKTFVDLSSCFYFMMKKCICVFRDCDSLLYDLHSLTLMNRRKIRVNKLFYFHSVNVHFKEFHSILIFNFKNSSQKVIIGGKIKAN